MKLSDLQNKLVVNIGDGKKIGNIVDVRIEETTGKIIALVIGEDKFLGFISPKKDMEIFWTNIVKIGEDVILVKLVF